MIMEWFKIFGVKDLFEHFDDAMKYVVIKNRLLETLRITHL